MQRLKSNFDIILQKREKFSGSCFTKENNGNKSLKTLESSWLEMNG